MQTPKPGFKFTPKPRKIIDLNVSNLVNYEPFAETGKSLPLLATPAVPNLNIEDWGTSEKQTIEEKLRQHGAILFRGFNLHESADFRKFVSSVTSDILNYKERSSPRTEIEPLIYTSTDYPPDQIIQFHNEQSYTKSFPMKLWFYCQTPSLTDGATPIADGRKVVSRLPEELVKDFLEKRVLYVRNYHEGIGLSWQTAFQTESKNEVSEICRKAGINFVWKGKNQLRTEQIFDNIINHPFTGEQVWFEHAMFFHLSALPENIKSSFLKEFAKEDLPSNTYFGDRTDIPEDYISQIKAAYKEESVRFTWNKGDVLVIDNVLTSHSRESFTGKREILVAMSDIHFLS